MKQKNGSLETYRLIRKLKKDDILKLSRMTCKHYHSYLSHPKCAFNDGIIIETNNNKLEIVERIGIFDIEVFSMRFTADMGNVLTYCIKELNKDLIITNSITPREAKKGENIDKRLMQDLVKDLKCFTRLVGYNSSNFDIPFLRTKAVKYNLDFPVYKEIYHSDLYYIIKNRFSLRHNSLRTACEFFGIEAKKHSFIWDKWAKAFIGDKKCLDYVLQHNIEDVLSTEQLWIKVNQHALLSKKSI